MTDATTGATGAAATAGATTATTAGTAGAAGAGTVAAAGTTDWTTGLTPELKGVVELKGWKEPAHIIESYRNVEKLTGDPNSLVKLPGKDAKPEDWAPVYDKLGRPKDGAGYEIAVPQGGDPKFAEWAGATLHEHGISKAAGQGLVAKWNNYVAEQQKQAETARSTANELENSKLKIEWGEAYPKQLEVAKRAAVGLGVDAATIDALENSMGFAKVMKFFNTLGSKMGEAEFVGGDGKGGFGGTMTPNAAMARIQELKGDKVWAKRYIDGGAVERAELERLHKLAYPGS